MWQIRIEFPEVRTSRPIPYWPSRDLLDLLSPFNRARDLSAFGPAELAGRRLRAYVIRTEEPEEDVLRLEEPSEDLSTTLVRSKVQVSLDALWDDLSEGGARELLATGTAWGSRRPSAETGRLFVGCLGTLLTSEEPIMNAHQVMFVRYVSPEALPALLERFGSFDVLDRKPARECT